MDSQPFPFWIDQRYQAVRLLGKGGGGQAVLAKKGNQTFAIKLFVSHLLKNPSKSTQKFKKEFLTLKKLNHPHIGKIFDFGFDSHLKQYYFVGEYIDGEEIHKACLKLSIEEKEKLFVQSLQALHYLHTYARAGIRHNDIKAANMLVTKNAQREPHLKLIDFGLASFVPLEVKGGTASYMSPEQIALTFPSIVSEKFPKPDHRTDLYSLGVVWYLCLTETNPFFIEKDSEATLKHHFNYTPLPPSTIQPDIPNYWDKILLKLLKNNPEERYANAAEAIQDLKFLSGKSYSVIPQSFRKHYLPEGGWIGQTQVWQPLRQKWDQLMTSPLPQPSIIWIVGERGQGKTKLLEHLKNYVQSHEGRFLLLRKDPEMSQEESITDLRRFTQDFSEPLVIAVDDFSKEHPGLKYLENLWQKLRYVKRWGKTTPIRWLFALTTDQAALQKNVPELESMTLFLKNFGHEELRELVKNPPESFLKKLKNHTDGNPLFVISVLQALGEQGLLWDDSGAWHPILFKDVGIDFNKLPIPQSLETALQKDWKSLNAKEKTLLKWLSCFPSGTHLATGEDEGLIEKGILVRDEKNRLSFKNSFLQRTVYQKLTQPEKQQYHQKIARLLKKQKAPPHQIAYHLAKTSQKPVRLKALEELAQFYKKTGRLEQALEAREEQTTLLPKKISPQKLEIVLKTSRLLNRLRKWEETQRLVDKWLEILLKKDQYKGWNAALLREKGITFLEQHAFAKARDCFEKALALVSKDKKRIKEQLILKNTIARTWLDERKLDKAIAIYKKTREVAKELPPQEASEVRNNDLGYVYLLLQDSKNALHFLEEDLKFYEKMGDKLRLLRCHYLLGDVLRMLTRDFDSAIKHYQLGANFAQDIKDTDWLMRIYNGLAATYLDRAHQDGGQNAYKQALRYFEESLALCQYLKKDSSELDFETSAIYLNIGTVHRELENYVKAHDAFQTILTVLEGKKQKNRRELGRLCGTYVSLADCLFAEKKYKEMAEPLKMAWQIAKDSKDLLEQQWAIQLLWAEMSQALRNFGEFKEHLDLAERLQTQYKIKPTPFAKKRLEELKKGL